MIVTCAFSCTRSIGWNKCNYMSWFYVGCYEVSRHYGGWFMTELWVMVIDCTDWTIYNTDAYQSPQLKYRWMSGFYAQMVFDLFRCCWSECTLTVKSVRCLWISISFKQSKLLKRHWRELDPIFKCIDNSISLWFVMGIQWIVIDRGHKIIMTWTVRSLFLSEREHQSIFSGTDQDDQLISLISN